VVLPQGIVGRHYLLSFRKGRSSVSYAKGGMKGSIEAPFLEFEQPLTWLPLMYFRVIHSVRKSPKRKRLSEHSLLIVVVVVSVFRIDKNDLHLSVGHYIFKDS